MSTSSFLDELNREYVGLHTRKEDAFWTAYMGLDADPKAARDRLDRAEIDLRRFLSDPERLKTVVRERDANLGVRDAGSASADADERLALEGWSRTLAAHTVSDPEARRLSEHLVEREGALARARAELPMVLRLPGGVVEAASTVGIGLTMATDLDPVRRHAAWVALREVETHVLAHGFLEVVALRNRFGRLLGGEDFYDATVRRTEGQTKAQVFAKLDELERYTREAGRRAIDELVREHGRDSVTASNVRFLMSGDVTREQDAYFPFGSALLRFGRTFAGLGIGYRGATVVVDLVDRPGKYENGFMHGPVVAWRDRGRHVPARIHFTANAIVGMPGSGRRALETLFHEGGHAAHFANCDMPAPCFGQEFAPTSVGFAETQSMFLDALVDDPDWLSLYARDPAGEAMPFALVEKGIRARQPFAAWSMRSMLATCYAERAIYEIPEDELTADRVLEAIRDVERRLLFLEEGSPRPTLAVPHLLAGESSAYYHGYVLAEMAVEQTRRWFLDRDGCLTANPRIGPELCETYWKPGNSRSFDAFVEGLTGAPVRAQPLGDRLSETAEQSVGRARQAYDRGRSLSPPPRVELDANFRVVHGREVIAEASQAEGHEGFMALCQTFERWIAGLRPG